MHREHCAVRVLITSWYDNGDFELRQNVAHNLAVNIGQSVVASLKPVRQLFMINAEPI